MYTRTSSVSRVPSDLRCQFYYENASTSKKTNNLCTWLFQILWTARCRKSTGRKIGPQEPMKRAGRMMWTWVVNSVIIGLMAAPYGCDGPTYATAVTAPNIGCPRVFQNRPQKERSPIYRHSQSVGRTLHEKLYRGPVRFLQHRHKSRVISVDDSSFFVRVTLWNPTRNAATPPLHSQSCTF